MKRFYTCIMIALMACWCMAQHEQLTNIPTIYIDTYNRANVTSKTNYIYATMTYVDGESVMQYDSLGIRGRGNSTWNLAKKPYRIKFNESTKFLGKGYAKNKSWTLLANHADKSLLRNAVTFAMGDFLGQPFSPAAHFVDVVLNGTYLGNYQVSDQINVDNKRVEIYEQEEIAADTSNITGGYLLEIDGFGNNEVVNFRTKKNLIVSVKSPDEDVINIAQRNYIKQYLNDFETALFRTDFTDVVDGYRAIVDSATLVSWYIATELSANVDGFWSTYLYKDRDDPRLYFGPLWDYDIAYNNCNRVGDVTNSTMVDAGFGSDLTKVWVKRMLQDPWFNEAVNNAWKQKVSEGLEEYLYQYIDSMAAHLEQSQEKNYNRYSISSRVYNEIYLYSTYGDYIAQLKDFIGDHMAFLTEVFAERANDVDDDDLVVELKPFDLQEEYYYRIYNKGTNKVLDIADASTVEGTGVVIWSPEYGRDTQLWQIVRVGEAYQLINKASGMAFNDPSPSSAVGTPVNVVSPDAEDSRQLWRFVTVNENDNYNIINVYTDHAINNSGGGATDGNNILSYTNDDRNAVSTNRQWRITPEELIPDYIAEEVKEALAATVAEAEDFLNSLSEEQIGDDIFCYQPESVDMLRQMVYDARNFESTVADDYILANVNLAEQLAMAKKKNMPGANRRYVIRHKISGYSLNVEADKLSVNALVDADCQHFAFEPASDGNGVYLKADNGLYVMLGESNSWTMVGQTVITDEDKATMQVSVVGDSYRIYTVNGLLGTDAVDDGSKVYADKREGYADEVARSEWLFEEYVDPLADVKHLLALTIEQAQAMLGNLNPKWVGTAPLQHSQQRMDDLATAIDEAQSYEYMDAEDYEIMVERLAESMENLHELNAPLLEVDYYLRHIAGVNLSCSEGLVMAQPDTLDFAQRFRMIPVEGAMNTYYIYTNGMYVTVSDGMLALTETPCDANGEFVAEQVSPNAFTLRSVVGYMGTETTTVHVGDDCVADATNWGSNVRWKLIEATNVIVDAVNPLDYKATIDYTIIYDKENETIRFASNDMRVLSEVEVCIYTVGGRMLYRFYADESRSVTELPGGTYIVRWNLGNKQHSVKFKKD